MKENNEACFSYVTIKEVEFMYALCTGNKEVLTSPLKKLSSCMLNVQATKRFLRHY